MPRMVIVISFEEPEDDMIMGSMILKAQEAYKNTEGVKIHMGRAEIADRVMAIFAPLHEGEPGGG